MSGTGGGENGGTPDGGAPAPPASDPAAQDPSANVCSATDEHHDWVHQVTGVDPRTYTSQAPDADAGTCQPGTPDPGTPAVAAPDAGPPAPVSSDLGAGGASAAGAGPQAEPRDAGADDPSGPPTPAPEAGPAPSDGAGGAPAANPAPAAEPEEGLLDRALDSIGWGPKARAAAARKETVDNAQKDLLGKTEEQLQKMSVDDKTRYISDLTANGAPKGNDLGALNRIYENTPTDPAYLKLQDQQSDQVAKELASDPALKAAQANWANLSDDEKAATMQKVVAAQSKAMGITPPDIVIERGMKEAGMTVSGVFKPEDGKLHINTDPDSMVSNFPEAISIATHENTHNYQDQLVKSYQNGTLKPGDPAYDQARMLAANNAPGAYVEPDSKNIDLYKQQPVERDAWNNGARTSRKVLNQLAGAGP